MKSGGVPRWASWGLFTKTQALLSACSLPGWPGQERQTKKTHCYNREISLWEQSVDIMGQKRPFFRKGNSPPANVGLPLRNSLPALPPGSSWNPDWTLENMTGTVIQL